MTTKAIIKNIIIIILGVLIIMCGGLYVGVSYSKLTATTVSSDPIETGAWAAYFNNAKTIIQKRIDDRDIKGPTIELNSTSMVLEAKLRANSVYSFSLDLHNQSNVSLRIVDIYKRITNLADNSMVTGNSLRFKTTYSNGVDVNIEDTLRPNETRKVIFTITADDTLEDGIYKFEYVISNEFLK